MERIRAEIVEVIRVEGNTGKGTKEDPARREVQYFLKNGKCIARGFQSDDMSAAASSQESSQSAKVTNAMTKDLSLESPYSGCFLT